MGRCVVCHAQLLLTEKLILCSPCFLLLKPAKQQGPGTTIYRYEKTLRGLILASKLHGNENAARFLLTTILKRPKAMAELTWCQEIMPAPSSFYSRLCGRFDLAFFLARELARVCQKPLVFASSRLYWQIFKQSRKKIRPLIQLSAPKPGLKRTLIIDDVITSGSTIQKIATSLKASSPRFLVIGDGRTFQK